MQDSMIVLFGTQEQSIEKIQQKEPIWGGPLRRFKPQLFTNGIGGETDRQDKEKLGQRR